MLIKPSLLHKKKHMLKADNVKADFLAWFSFDMLRKKTLKH